MFVPAFGNDVLDRPGRPGDAGAAWRRGAADRLHHRFVRGPAAVLPRRRHRPAGGAWHGQRPGGRRRQAAVPVRRVHPRRGLAAGRSEAHRRFDAPGLRRGRRHAGHRRHQGRGSRQGRRRLHHDFGHRHCARGPVACRFTRRGPAIASSFPARSATTASPSCRCARDSNSRRCWKATRAALERLDAKRCWRRARTRAVCATRRAAACRAL